MNTLVLAFLAVVLAIATGVLLLLLEMHRNSPHRDLYTQDHIHEFFQCIREMKDRLAPDDQSSDEPWDAEFTTSVGLYVLYSIEPIQDVYLHHYSISKRTGRIAFAAGGYFSFLLANAFGIGSLELRCAYSSRGVTHTAFTPPFRLSGTNVQGSARAARLFRLRENS